MLLIPLLKTVIKDGELTVVEPSGRIHKLGDPGKGPSVTIRLHDRALLYTLAVNPRLLVGEAFMNGTLTVESGTVYDFLDLFGLNTGVDYMNDLDRYLSRMRNLWNRVRHRNSVKESRRNVAHHYDLSGALYDLFLDRDRQYSCAYFASPDMDLDAAQAAKKVHIAAKLKLESGQNVLDIGSGWGGLALHLAETLGVQVTGITLSSEQLAYAQKRAEQAAAGNRVRFKLCDYREERGRYDRVVSVGMFEHVGLRNYRDYFRKIAEVLTEDGVAVVHTISHRCEPYPTNPWIDKYIFPGGYIPALSEVLPAVEESGLKITDIEILRLHYAETLRHWRERFAANRHKAAALYDERFCRMWEFYLSASETAFRHQGHMVAQLQLAKPGNRLPYVRDYITEWERAHEGEAA